MCKAHTKLNESAARPREASPLARMTAIAGGILLGAILVAGWERLGHAAIPQDDPFANLEVLDAAEMAEKRGGFLDSVLGIRLNLGASIRTAINGQLVLETLVKFADTGATQVSHTVAPGVDLPALTFLGSDGTPIAGISNQKFPGPVTFQANGTSVTVPAGFQGLVAMSDSGGIIAAVNNVTKEQFANLVINSDPLTKINQELDIKIDVQGFAQLQQNVRLNASMEKFRSAMRSASLGALGTN